MADKGQPFDWEQRYRAEPQLFDTKPSELLVNHRHYLQSGMTVLAVGDGEGRNGVWLAEQGLHVTSVDIAPTALARAEEFARQRHVELQTLCIDILDWEWPQRQYDIVTSIFVHMPSTPVARLHQAMAGALKPGGLVMLEGFEKQQQFLDSGGPRDPDLLFSEQQLRENFAGCEVVHVEHCPTDVCMGGQHLGSGRVIHFIARRPPGDT